MFSSCPPPLPLGMERQCRGGCIQIESELYSTEALSREFGVIDTNFGLVELYSRAHSPGTDGGAQLSMT